jgi:hypothetical protein
MNLALGGVEPIEKFEDKMVLARLQEQLVNMVR